jgi:CheY-like chemotaxis protein
MKILIVEDDPVSLKLAGEVLHAGGHVVMLAASADQAIFSIRTVLPDVRLLDLRLPGIKGTGVARQCREKTYTHDIPIIAVTAYPIEFGEEEALESGCDAYITKPLNTRTLMQQIEDVVAAKAADVLTHRIKHENPRR